MIPDWEWVSDPLRAYPIVIDPVIQLSASNLEWCLVENGVGTSRYPAGPNVEHVGNSFLYVGFERGELTGFPGLSYGMTRSYIKINNAYRLNAAMLQICHCEAVGRGNLQHRSWITDAPIHIEHLGFTMLIG